MELPATMLQAVRNDAEAAAEAIDEAQQQLNVLYESIREAHADGHTVPELKQATGLAPCGTAEHHRWRQPAGPSNDRPTVMRSGTNTLRIERDFTLVHVAIDRIWPPTPPWRRSRLVAPVLVATVYVPPREVGSLNPTSQTV